MRTCLLDADMVAFRCAASANEEPLDVALERADSLIDRIMSDTGSHTLEAWLTGSNNFREVINPQYKANRKDKPRPVWLQDVREHIVTGWGGRVSDGNEADDELGISQCAGDGNTVIVSNDKDMLMIPGEHYNPITLARNTISPRQGMLNFYYQMIMGDSSDNIFGFDGKARQKVPKFLEPTISMLMECKHEYEMWEFVSDLYDRASSGEWEETFNMNAQCLWIQRKNGDKWQEPKPHDSNQG